MWDAPGDNIDELLDQRITAMICPTVRMMVHRFPMDWIRSGHAHPWIAGEFMDHLIGLAIEHLNGLGANQLLGRDMEPVGVALDRVEKPGSSVVAEVGVSSRARICCKVSVGVRGATVSGRMTACGSPSPTT